MGVPWLTALGAVFLSGVAFLILTLTGLRQMIIAAIPTELYSAVAAGVGLFIALIGFRNAGIIVSDPATTVTLGNLRDPHTLLAVFGLLLIAVLLAWRVQAAMLLGILSTTLVGEALGLVPWSPQSYKLSEISATVLQLDIASTAKIGLIEIVFVFLFVDLFDNIGTLVAVGKKAGCSWTTGFRASSGSSWPTLQPRSWDRSPVLRRWSATLKARRVWRREEEPESRQS
jgi:AGZA family xanthine/uracil permease-like MFS transporter